MTTLQFINPKDNVLEFIEDGKAVKIIEEKPKNQTLEVGSPTVVNIFNDGDPLLEQRVTDHINDTSNPHEVTSEQLPDGQDLTLLFNNALL